MLLLLELTEKTVYFVHALTVLFEQEGYDYVDCFGTEPAVGKQRLIVLAVYAGRLMEVGMQRDRYDLLAEDLIESCFGKWRLPLF